MSRLLALDIGNSECKLALFVGREVARSTRVPSHPAPDRQQMRGAVRALLGADAATPPSALCSAVPELAGSWREALEGEVTSVFQVEGPEVARAGLRVCRMRPESVGADRLVGALAAWTVCGGPVVVVNAGTATVVDAVSAEGEFLGGAIAPGVAMGLRSLAAGTALLPRVEPADPGEVIGADTAAAMRSGVIYGTVGAIRELSARMRAVVAAEATLVLTGGFAPLLSPHLEAGHLHLPYLTLEGVHLAWQAHTANATVGPRQAQPVGPAPSAAHGSEGP